MSRQSETIELKVHFRFNLKTPMSRNKNARKAADNNNFAKIAYTFKRLEIHRK